MKRYTKPECLKRIVRIQAAWKGYQIRRVIAYLKATQKVQTIHDLEP